MLHFNAQMRAEAAEHALETYKLVRRKFFTAGEALFGPGVMSMAEYYFTRKVGRSPFSLIFSEPQTVYDGWVEIFKGERVVGQLIQKAVGPNYQSFISDMKRNDAIRVWSALEQLASPNPWITGEW